MKQKLFFLLFLLNLILVPAQKINEIFLLNQGKSAILNIQIANTTILMNTDGTLMNINAQNRNKLAPNFSTVTFNGDSDIDYDDPKSFAANSDIKYYDDFYDYSSGKLKSVADVNFKYNDGFYNYLKGKIDKIGDLQLKYYDDFYSYNSGKMKSIGNLTFNYFDDFYYYKSGKLKSIKGNNNNIKITVIND